MGNRVVIGELMEEVMSFVMAGCTHAPNRICCTHPTENSRADSP